METFESSDSLPGEDRFLLPNYVSGHHSLPDREMDISEGSSFGRRSIPRKPVPQSSPQPLPHLEKFNEGPTSATARYLPNIGIWKCAKGIALMLLSAPFFVYGSIVWHLNNMPINDAAHQLSLIEFGNKVRFFYDTNVL
jgi:hypothetical protein